MVVLEKGSEPGAHILSGAVMDPRGLNELMPDWKAKGAPLTQAVTEDQFLFLTRNGTIRTPGFLLPDCFNNHGNYIVSLSNVVKWLAQQAEALGVEIFPGFAAAEVLFNEAGAVRGVATGNMGVGRDGQPARRLPDRHGAARQVHRVCRRRARPPGPPAHRPLQARRRPRPAKLCARGQGAVGSRCSPAPPGPGGAHRRLAHGWRHLRRRVPLPPG